MRFYILIWYFLMIIFFGCNHNPYRLKYYRVYPVNSGQVELMWLDSAYVAGDTVNLATPCNKSIVNMTYVVEGRAK